MTRQLDPVLRALLAVLLVVLIFVLVLVALWLLNFLYAGQPCQPALPTFAPLPGELAP